MTNKQFKETYDRVLDQVHVGEGNIFGFLAATAAYNGGDDWVRQLMEYLTGNLRFLQDYIGRHIPLIKVIPPQATYLVWLDCRQLGMSAEALRSFMIHEAGIGLNDGPQFGLEGEGFQRINIGCSRRVLQPALMKLHRAVDKKFNI
jgi:cystathionine beta-lyase